MRAKNLPNIAKTVEWIEKNHVVASNTRELISDWCKLCGGTWPCASIRMAREIKRLWGKKKQQRRSSGG